MPLLPGIIIMQLLVTVFSIIGRSNFGNFHAYSNWTFLCFGALDFPQVVIQLDGLYFAARNIKVFERMAYVVSGVSRLVSTLSALSDVCRPLRF